MLCIGKGLVRESKTTPFARSARAIESRHDNVMTTLTNSNPDSERARRYTWRKKEEGKRERRNGENEASVCETSSSRATLPANVFPDYLTCGYRATTTLTWR